MEGIDLVHFSVGYQLMDGGGDTFLDIVRDFRDRVAEVYFPWADMPSGRASLVSRRGYTSWEARETLERDLAGFRDLGIKLNLLFNASCYGEYAVSGYLQNQVCSVLDHLRDRVGGVEVVTTTSPAIAHVIKTRYPDTSVRASVNMRIGSREGMEYLAHLFDEFHVRREHNRDPDHLRDLRAWARERDKKLSILANSGCMYRCSGQTFHDNLVAHERAIDEVEKIPGWNPHLCWEYLKDRDHWSSILKNTWIRPEDLAHYAELFPVVKLATRMHARPRMVLRAYVEGWFRGNLLNLFEPGFGPRLAPYIIDNRRFPEDWFARTTRCGRDCAGCSYCDDVLKRVLVHQDDYIRQRT